LKASYNDFAFPMDRVVFKITGAITGISAFFDKRTKASGLVAFWWIKRRKVGPEAAGDRLKQGPESLSPMGKQFHRRA
jgi:hypothetical protein